MVEGQATEQYLLLWDFAEEIKRTNPGSTVIVGADDSTGEHRFDRLYLCLQALMMGFLAGCRHFIGVDGCHLKGPHGGVLLSAVGVDPNNNIFPIAFAIVSSETKDTWDWFLCLLKMDLKIDKDYEWTFMFDKQKGLIQACDEIFSNSDHLYCVRHLHSNFKNAGFRGDSFRNALWSCASATTVNEFRKRMLEIRAIDQNVADWFNDKEPHQWSKSHFSEKSKCDILLNNSCESFNSSILEARNKQILSMCEWIVEYLMKRMQINRDRAEDYWTKGVLCPKIQKLVDKNFQSIGDCIPIKADNTHYRLSCYDGNYYSVDLERKTCGCRRWEISGIPCVHAMSAIYAQDLDHYNFVDDCYKLETYKMVYAHVIMPTNGRSEWKPTGMTPISPPSFGRSAGRPKKARRRETDEPAPHKTKKRRAKAKGPTNGTRIKRQQMTLRCRRCGVSGHNRRTCETEIEKPAVRNKFVGESSKQAMPGPMVSTAPSMFKQFQSCQMQTQGVNIRAPAPFVGGSYIKNVETNVPRSCITITEVITEGGIKYATISSLASTAAAVDIQWKKEQNQKGNETGN
ncbi:uncharacterized protein [Henckelia pumila]|uniref:uncharacterized protein n=1 Tax=Henckelia pumila TaxID=405737 RepID=UPI003C6DD9DB